MDWLAYAKTASASDGVFTTDVKGHSFILEWKKSDILSPGLAAFKKDLSDLASEKLSSSELAFLKANPEAASSELFLRACKPLLDKGITNTDWHAVQEAIKASVKQFYLADLSKFGWDMIKPLLNDLYFYATFRDPDEKELSGFLLFSITPALPFGDVKVINFFMREHHPSSELQNILMGLVFKILPQTKRIFLFARPTDSVINKIGSTPDVDWNIGEFFIVSKFQEKGVGSYVAEQIFDQFPGIWETSQIPENRAALDFWRKVVDSYTNGQFEKSLKTIVEPKPHPMVVLKFASKGKA